MIKKILFGIFLFQFLFLGITIADNSIKYKQIKHNYFFSRPITIKGGYKYNHTFEYMYRFGKIDLKSKKLKNELFYDKSGKCNKQIGYDDNDFISLVFEYEYKDGFTIETEIYSHDVWSSSCGFSYPSNDYDYQHKIRRKILKYDAKNLLNERLEYLEDGTLYLKDIYDYDTLERQIKLQRTFYDFSISYSEINYNHVNDTCIIKTEKSNNRIDYDTLYYNRNYELIRQIGNYSILDGQIITDRFREIIYVFNEQTNLLQIIHNDEKGLVFSEQYQYNKKNQLVEYTYSIEGEDLGFNFFDKTYNYYKIKYKYDKFDTFVEDIYYVLNNEAFLCRKHVYFK